MRHWPVGTRVFICGNSNHHNYTVGRAYVVSEVDDDGTFKARDAESGIVGNWLRWEDVDITPPIGWEFCKTVLPAEVVSFLGAFDGIENIILRDEMKNRLLRRVPNLYEVIVEENRRAALEELAAGAPPITFPSLRAMDKLDDDSVITEEEARRMLQESDERADDAGVASAARPAARVDREAIKSLVLESMRADGNDPEPANPTPTGRRRPGTKKR